ncbi:MAG: PEP-CTERM sorting domain-containing protein [Pseudomonadota bacterium]
MDFESAPNSGSNPIFGVDGFDFDFTASGWFIGDPSVFFYPGTTNGTNILALGGDRNGQNANVVMTKSGGGAFDLGTLDAAGFADGTTNMINVVGALFGGGSVSQVLSVGDSFTSYMLTGFEDVVSVTFESQNSGFYNTGSAAGFALDNLDTTPGVSVVPLPGALPLLLIGLGGLGVAARRRSAPV